MANNREIEYMNKAMLLNKNYDNCNSEMEEPLLIDPLASAWGLLVKWIKNRKRKWSKKMTGIDYIVLTIAMALILTVIVIWL